MGLEGTTQMTSHAFLAQLPGLLIAAALPAKPLFRLYLCIETGAGVNLLAQQAIRQKHSTYIHCSVQEYLILGTILLIRICWVFPLGMEPMYIHFVRMSTLWSDSSNSPYTRLVGQCAHSCSPFTHIDFNLGCLQKRG